MAKNQDWTQAEWTDPPFKIYFMAIFLFKFDFIPSAVAVCRALENVGGKMGVLYLCTEEWQQFIMATTITSFISGCGYNFTFNAQHWQQFFFLLKISKLSQAIKKLLYFKPQMACCCVGN